MNILHVTVSFVASLVLKVFLHCSRRFESRLIGEFVGSLVGWLIYFS